MAVHDGAPEGRGRNFYLSDAPLRGLLASLVPPEHMARAESLLREMGRLAGDAIDRQAEYTDRCARPRLESHDRQGVVANTVVYNPLYEESVRQVYGLGIVGCCYGPNPLPFTVHFALLHLLAQSDPGLACPVTLTAATAFVIDRHGSEAQRRRYLPGLAVRGPGAFLDGATWITERQGGSDAGSAQTVAQPLGVGDPRAGYAADAALHAVRGEKWFASNADADVVLLTARPVGAPPGTEGLGLYLMPRRLPDGRMNAYRIRRLKDKLGTTGLATGEIELDGAVAEEVTAPPQGFAHMLEAIGISRVANAVAAAGVQRRALLEARLYAQGRSAFGQPIDRYPMVRETLTTLAADLEASLCLAFESAATFDAVYGAGRAEDLAWLRLVTALAKYRTGELCVTAAHQAIEVLGGNGYVEDYVTARLLREAQVLPVWEGPPNIQALEALRALGPHLGASERLRQRLGAVCGLAAESEASRDLGLLLGQQTEAFTRALASALQTPHAAARSARRLSDWAADLLELGILLERALGDMQRNDHRLLQLAWWRAAHTLAARPGHGADRDFSWLDGAWATLVAGESSGAVRLPNIAGEVALR